MDIPVTDDTFGVIHSDFHTSNYMMQQLDDGSWDMTAIDFDNAQRSWYIIDLGTVCFCATKQIDAAYRAGKFNQDVGEMIQEQFKTWIVEAYGMPVDPVELVEACVWRKDFEYWMRMNDLDTLDPASADYAVAQDYVNRYNDGTMPSC